MGCRLSFFTVVLVLVCGCNSQNSKPHVTAPPFQAPQTDLVAALEQEVSALQQRVDALEFDKMIGDWSRTNKFVSLSLDEKGYIPVETTLGQLLVASGTATPYMDGYKIDFQIGNPQSVTYDGVTVTLKWGPSANPTIFTNNTALKEWQNAQKTKTDKLLSRLLPGYWNNAEVIVAPATTEEIRNLEISIETGTLLLGTESRSR